MSCRSGTDARFGTSGTIAKKVTEDPQNTWFLSNYAATLVLLTIRYRSRDNFKAVFSSSANSGISESG